MSAIIMRPVQGDGVYNRAAVIFKEMYEKVTGVELKIVDEDDGISDLFVIGSDAVNDFLMDEMLEGHVGSLNIRYGTEDYCIRSYKREQRNILILAGGRGRSTLYAVYDYFERYAECHYFWDGDIIPHVSSIQIEDIDIVESPRFEYRGLRYFAHRGLKRFQAEHWSFEDWKQEIDWLVKRRLNFFMLRIGMDDIWQRAFPEIVPYPKEYRTIIGADANGFDDRSDFWTLEYRGQLREKILEYARDMDLMSPVDCGTMTHWYSRTPEEFLEAKKPIFLQQADEAYTGTDTGKVWDFRKKEEMDNYMRLTETMINEYDKNSYLFHTIGLGERRIFKDKQKNFNLKLIAYRRIAESLRQRYPNSKLMLAGWDFYYTWTSDEVQGMMKELDPERTIVLDYTSEGGVLEKNFVTWDVVGKFPWIFGLFHAYEPDSELRGPYDRIDEKLKIAAEDAFCKGMVLWPELSHSDPLILEYLTQNAWRPLERNIEEITEDFCYKRYGEYAEQMNICWQRALPLIKLNSWDHAPVDKWCRLTTYIISETNPNLREKNKNKVVIPADLFEDIVSVLEKLAEIEDGYSCEFVLRDAVDIARTIVGRFLNYLIKLAMASSGDAEKVSELEKYYMELLDVMEKILCLNTDFSLYHSLMELQKVAPLNPNFEVTLKRNIYNDYCAQSVYELVGCIYKEEGKLAFEWLKTAPKRAVPNYENAMGVITENFMKTPLEQMQPKITTSPREVFIEAAEVIKKLQKFL